MQGSYEYDIDEYSDSDDDAYEKFLTVKQTQKRNALARRKLEQKLERKQLRKRIDDFYDLD